MNVLFMMFAFPNMNNSFNMFTSLVEEFHKNNHKVFVVAPAYNNSISGINIEKDITILRIKTLPVKNIHHYLKGLANILLPYQFGIAIKNNFKNEKFDLVIIPTPPITLVDLAVKIKRKHNSLLYLMLRDIFPQNAVDMGFIKKGSLIYKYFRKKEKKLYENADLIGCMSQGNISYLKKNNKIRNESKLHILRNLQMKYDLNTNIEISVKKKYGLENKFIAVFGGNIGKPQQIENIIALAEYCKKYEDVIFLILGEGVQKQSLDRIICKRNLTNVITKNTIPKSDYQNLIRECDIGLISLHENFTIPNIPSKTLDYFNVGIPVLASIDKATDYGEILDESGAGLWSYAQDSKKFKENFDKLYFNSELRKTIGENGRKYFEKYLIPEIAYETVINQIRLLNNQNVS